MEWMLSMIAWEAALGMQLEGPDLGPGRSVVGSCWAECLCCCQKP